MANKTPQERVNELVDQLRADGFTLVDVNSALHGGVEYAGTTYEAAGLSENPDEPRMNDEQGSGVPQNPEPAKTAEELTRDAGNADRDGYAPRRDYQE